MICYLERNIFRSIQKYSVFREQLFLVGAYETVDTPVIIPNTEVKHCCDCFSWSFEIREDS